MITKTPAFQTSDNKTFGAVMKSKTRSMAWMLGGHTPVILVEGITGAYALERVTAA